MTHAISIEGYQAEVDQFAAHIRDSLRSGDLTQEQASSAMEILAASCESVRLLSEMHDCTVRASGALSKFVRAVNPPGKGKGPNVTFGEPLAELVLVMSTRNVRAQRAC